jgi:two-component system cell cycle response regulator DivK
MEFTNMHRILVIEDKPQNMSSTYKILENRGHTLIEACNGGEGIRIAKEEQPDLIVMDTDLPGLDGPTTAQLLKINPLTRDIKIIALTALLAVKEREKLLHLGAYDSLDKPFLYEDLIGLIDTALTGNAKLKM